MPTPKTTPLEKKQNFTIEVTTPSIPKREVPKHTQRSAWLADQVPIIDKVPKSIDALAHYIFKHTGPAPRPIRPLLFEGGSQYGALNFFTQNLCTAFKLRGHKAESIDLSTAVTGNANKCSAAIKRLDPTLYISMNGIHEALRLANHKTFAQHFKVPSISWFVDHPFIQMSRIYGLDYPEKINAHAVVDGYENVNSRIRQSDSRGFDTPLPMVGMPLFDVMKPFAERSNRLLVPASFTPFAEKYATLSIPKYPLLERLCKDTVEYLIASPNNSADTFFMDGLEALGMDPVKIETRLLTILYVGIHQSAEMYWRENMLKAAKNVPLKLFGRGWEKADFISDKWEVCAPPPMDVLAQWYADAQHVWNIFPLYPKTGHDRIFYATANGANVITEHKDWLGGVYGDTLNYLTQEFDQVEDALNTMIHAPVADRAEQADRGQRFTLSRRTYLSAVVNIEQILERHRLRQDMYSGNMTLNETY